MRDRPSSSPHRAVAPRYVAYREFDPTAATIGSGHTATTNPAEVTP